MGRYRFKKEMAPRVTIRLLAICTAVVALCVAIGMIGEADQTMVQAKQTNTIATANPAKEVAGEAIVKLNKTTIQQEGNLVIINKKRLWPEGYEPSDLVGIKDYKTTSAFSLKDSAMRANKSAILALDKMLKDAGAAGIRGIVIMSSYRGYEKQRILFEEKVGELLSQAKNKEQAETMANQTVARPGESEHHTGLAFDLAVNNIAMQQFGDTEQGQWIKNHCASYGFVLRYLPEKAAYTGIASEPWHFRYVGLDAARKMVENGWCLEEYVAYQP